MAGLVALGTASCQVVERREVPVVVDAEPLKGRAVRVWEAVSRSGERLGLLVRFEASLASEVHFMVRNPWHQDLGLIDANGRAYRFLPHARDPVWVGTGTIAEGVARVLEAGACELLELPFEPASDEPRTASAESAGL